MKPISRPTPPRRSAKRSNSAALREASGCTAGWSASGNTITTVLEVADAPDAADWREIASNEVAATGTALSGDIFSFIPDVDEHYMRVKVSNSTGMTGKFSVAPELIP